MTPMVPLYGVWTVAFSGELRVKVALADMMVSVTGPVVVTIGLLESVAFTVRVGVPAVVSVPLIAQPVADSPAGSVLGVITHVYGAVPPLTPTVPL